MRSPMSVQFPESVPPEPPRGPRRWYTAPTTWAVVTFLAFLAVAVIPVAVTPKTQWAELHEPRMPCEVIDWRVGEKLAVLAEREDPRTRAIVSRMNQQRDVARQQCRAGHLDDALAIYRLVDRALTRYVQSGTAPNLPK